MRQDREWRLYRVLMGRGRGGGGVLDAMHDRCRMTIDPRIPTMPGQSHVVLSPTRQTLLAQSAKRCALFGGWHEG